MSIELPNGGNKNICITSMPWRSILRLLLSRHSNDIIQKLAESESMKRAARYSAYWILRGQDKGNSFLKDKEGTVESFKYRLNRFKKTYEQELEKEKKKLGGGKD